MQLITLILKLIKINQILLCSKIDIIFIAHAHTKLRRALWQQCPSVCLWYSDILSKRLNHAYRIDFLPSRRSIILVFSEINAVTKFFDGVTPLEAVRLAGSNITRGCCVSTPTQRAIPTGSVN